MIYIYKLQIHSHEYNIQEVGKILELDKYKNLKWEYKIEITKHWLYFEVTKKEKDLPFFYIDFFLDILENKYELLSDIGIQRDDITIWKLYGYNNQCNMEWEAKDLKRLGDNGIKLCVSCWESDE